MELSVGGWEDKEESTKSSTKVASGVEEMLENVELRILVNKYFKKEKFTKEFSKAKVIEDFKKTILVERLTK